MKGKLTIAPPGQRTRRRSDFQHAPQKKSPATCAPFPLPHPMYRHSQIADRAYEIRLKEGRPEKREIHRWFEADRQLRGQSLQDDATRLSADPLDPASSKSAETDAETRHMAGEPSSRSPTSLTQHSLIRHSNIRNQPSAVERLEPGRPPLGVILTPASP